MLAQEKLMAFVSTADAVRARAFYEGVLGLALAIDDEHLMVLESDGWRVALQKGDKVTPPHGTAMGWWVADLRGTVRALMDRGVVFEKFGLDQDELGVWSPAPGHGVAWFKDPDGNLLSVSN